MNERFTTIEAQLAILEVSNNSTRVKSQNSDEFHQTQEEQKKTRVAATGFHEDTTGQEAQELLTATILANTTLTIRKHHDHSHNHEQYRKKETETEEMRKAAVKRQKKQERKQRLKRQQHE